VKLNESAFLRRTLYYSGPSIELEIKTIKVGFVTKLKCTGGVGYLYENQNF